MEQTNKTETEQLYDDMTKLETDEEQTRAETEQAKQEQTGEQEDVQDEEEILTEEQLEIEREIEAYQTKIEKLDAKLNEFKNEHIDAMKREQMKKAHYTDEQIERYLPHVESGTVDEIKASVLKLSLEIPPGNDNFADPSPFNGRAAKPKTVDHTEIGRQAFDRVKHKIFPRMRGR